ncbi:hypothetical protein PVAP13_8NG268902 [Panicum virgatum]|uniref:Uncharacterized protein n=1 Tax=Panicum virgatum TaxID=38727 RepID=A0A8T0PC23_PANVG|nr:hypothetical protein PVAP13_8NG268902 [Panicum virgatum]
MDSFRYEAGDLTGGAELQDLLHGGKRSPHALRRRRRPAHHGSAWQRQQPAASCPHARLLLALRGSGVPPLGILSTPGLAPAQRRGRRCGARWGRAAALASSAGRNASLRTQRWRAGVARRHAGHRLPPPRALPRHLRPPCRLRRTPHPCAGRGH